MRLLLFFCLCFLACKQNSPIQKTNEVADILNQDRYKNCKMTAEEFGEKFLKSEVKLNDFNSCDSLLLEVISDLGKRPMEKQIFWFSVLSKLAPVTDGYLAEGFDVMAYGFIRDNPALFAKNVLAVKKDFSIENNVENWARKVKSEISIAYEGEEAIEIETYIKQLNKQYTTFSKEEKTIIDTFCQKLLGQK